MIDFGLNNGISPEVNGRLNQIYYYLKNMNLDDVHIAAIMGNIRQESGYNVDPWSNTKRFLYIYLIIILHLKILYFIIY